MQLYRNLERIFERISNIGFRLFANSIVFFLSLILVSWWPIIHNWKNTNLADAVRDVILAITFISFFIIQRTFSHFSQALHLKLDELVLAKDKARNHLIKAEEKTTEELAKLANIHTKARKD